MAGGLSPIGFGAPAPQGFGAGSAGGAVGDLVFAKSLPSDKHVLCDGLFKSVPDSFPFSRIPQGCSITQMVSLNVGSLGAIATRPSDGRTVCVGDQGGLIVTTANGGTSWTRQNVNSSHQLFDVIWDGSRFIAVGSYFNGSDRDIAVIWVSADGLTWTNHLSSFPLPAPLSTTSIYKIIYANGV